MDMVWGNNKARIMIWHPFVALGCVFMIERIVQEENLLFKCWFRLPYSCMPGTVYVQRAKDAGYHPASFTLSHQLNGGSRVLGRQHFHCFFRRSLCMLHDRFVKAIFTFCARDA